MNQIKTVLHLYHFSILVCTMCVYLCSCVCVSECVCVRACVWCMLSFLFEHCLPTLVCTLLVVKLVSQIQNDLYLNVHVSSVTFALFGALSCRVGTLKLSIIIIITTKLSCFKKGAMVSSL